MNNVKGAPTSEHRVKFLSRRIKVIGSIIFSFFTLLFVKGNDAQNAHNSSSADNDHFSNFIEGIAFADTPPSPDGSPHGAPSGK